MDDATKNILKTCAITAGIFSVPVAIYLANESFDNQACPNIIIVEEIHETEAPSPFHLPPAITIHTIQKRLPF